MAGDPFKVETPHFFLGPDMISLKRKHPLTKSRDVEPLDSETLVYRSPPHCLLHVEPQLQDAIRTIIREYLSLRTRHRASTIVELETSLGQRHEGKFCPGVEYGWFCAFYRSLYNATETSPKLWTRSESKYKIQYCADGSRVSIGCAPSPVRVKKARPHTLELVQNGHAYECRLSVSTETPSVANRNRLSHTCTMWRFVDRTSFIYHDGTRYDLSKVAHGATQAETMRAAIRFEIEVDFTNVAKITEQLITERAVDVFGRYDQNGQPIPFDLSLSTR